MIVFVTFLVVVFGNIMEMMNGINFDLINVKCLMRDAMLKVMKIRLVT